MEQVIGEDWLNERGALNDARIVKISRLDADLFIFLDDEWSNVEGLENHHQQLGAIHVVGMAGEPRMVSDVEVDRLELGLIRLSVFCYGQHKLDVTEAAVTWIVGARP